MTSGPIVAYRLKVRPEDFRVEEISDLPLKRRGVFHVYRLTKSGWNTVDLLRRIARSARCPFEEFSFGGRKDRQAVTTQLVTVRSPRDLSRSGADFSLERIGSSDERMRPERLLGNEFTIVLRGLDPEGIGRIARNAEVVAAQGLTNYFDDQRFGGFDPAEGFAGEHIMKGEWERALRLLLTSAGAEEDGPGMAHRSRLRERWRGWKECLSVSRTTREKRVFGFLATRRAVAETFVQALHLLPREEISMALSAWQSHLWNLIAAEATRDVAEQTVSVPGIAGAYLFALRVGRDGAARYRRWVIPTPGPRVRFPDPRTEELHRAVLARFGFRQEGLRSPARLRAAYLKSFPRPLHLRAEGLRVVDRGPDDAIPGREKATIRFRVGRGSYGTMVVKRLSVG